jgi:hypothetical protein
MAEVNRASNRLTPPQWAGDWLDRDSLLPGGAKLDASQFVAEDAVRVVVATGGAAQNATSIPVAALSGPIPSGTVLDFGGAKFARLTAPAAAGNTALTVSALVTALVAADAATYAGTKKKVVPSGTYVGRTITERDAGTGFGPAAATDDERFLTVFDVADADRDNDIELYRHLRVVKENLLPNYTTLSANADLIAKLRSDYLCTKGVA